MFQECFNSGKIRLEKGVKTRAELNVANINFPDFLNSHVLE